MEEKFGPKLKQWRNKMGISQNVLAQKSGVSPVTIGQIESGKRKARHLTRRKLLEGLGISESKLLGSAEVEAAPVFSIPAPAAKVEMVQAAAPRKEVPLVLSNLDLEIINRTLNLNFENKLNTIKYLKNLE